MQMIFNIFQYIKIFNQECYLIFFPSARQAITAAGSPLLKVNKLINYRIKINCI